jgi:DNA primase
MKEGYRLIYVSSPCRQGEDPDSFIRQDKTAWPKLLQSAKPVVEYVIQVLLNEADLNDPKAKSAVAEQVIPLIEDVSNPVERDHYWQYLARALRIDDRSLRQMQVPDKNQRRQRKTIDAGPAVQRSTRPWPQPHTSQKYPEFEHDDTRQINFLRFCLNDPTIIGRVNQRLMQCGEPWLTAQEFLNPLDQALFLYMQEQILVAPPAKMWDSLDDLLQQRIEKLLRWPLKEVDAQREYWISSLVQSILKWRFDAVNQQIGQLRQLTRDAHSQHDEEAKFIYTQQSMELTALRSRLDKAQAVLRSSKR